AAAAARDRRARPASGWSSASGSRSRRAGSWFRLPSLPLPLERREAIHRRLRAASARGAVDHLEEVIDAGEAEELLDVARAAHDCEALAARAGVQLADEHP